MKEKRLLIKIDEELCDGCGACVPGCEEGALQIIDGKARLVAEKYCDGLGNCLGHCPTGALTLEEIEADAFDEDAVEERLAEIGRPPLKTGGCPSAQIMQMQPAPQSGGPTPEKLKELQPQAGAALSHWPLQLHLVPQDAPFLQDAHILLAADCVPPAFPQFHSKYLRGRILLLGCPKFDDTEAYRKKLTAIFKTNNIASLTILEMDVPCCSNMHRLAQTALQAAEKDIPSLLVTIGRDGKELKREALTVENNSNFLQPLS
jgi:NAD-dependent dihydropyrimidine dehydrogenase PreA subunit